MERQPRTWPTQASECSPPTACSGPPAWCWSLSIGAAGAVTKLIHHTVPTRQMDKDPCVCQDKLSAHQHPQLRSLRTFHLPGWNRCGVLRPKPQILDLQGGQLLNLGWPFFLC